MYVIPWRPELTHSKSRSRIHYTNWALNNIKSHSTLSLTLQNTFDSSTELFDKTARWTFFSSFYRASNDLLNSFAGLFRSTFIQLTWSHPVRVTTRRPIQLTWSHPVRVTTRRPIQLTWSHPARVTTRRPIQLTWSHPIRITTRRPIQLTLESSRTRNHP